MNFELCGLLAMAIALPCAAAGQAAGTWEGTFSDGANTFEAGFDLDVNGDKITGDAFERFRYARISDGRVDGDHVQFVVDRRSGGTITKVEFAGVVVGKLLSLEIVDGTKYQACLHRVESQITGPVQVGAAPKELAGRWTAQFVGRISERPKMIDRIDFDLRVDGNAVTGVAHMAGWPWDCPISEGKVANGHFSFTATGSVPSSSGIPVMWFEGEMHENGLKMTMHHQIFFATDNKLRLPMDAVR